MPKPWIFYCESEEQFYQTALEDLLARIELSLKKFSECRLGLAGGSTPKLLYEKLAKEDLSWEKIKIIQLDERYVSSDDEESNLRMLRESLLMCVPIPPENILTFDTALPYESAAEEMNRKLTQLENPARPLLDCLILGAGADGHIASLFEEDPALKSTNYASPARALHYRTPKRLTLTLRALEQASSALLLLKGSEKIPVLDALQEKIKNPPLTALHELASKMSLKVVAYLQK